MTEKRIRCDSCGAPALEVRFNYQRVFDGNSTESESDTIDLCHTHAIERLQMFLVEPPKAPAECGKDQFTRWAKQQKWAPKP